MLIYWGFVYHTKGSQKHKLTAIPLADVHIYQLNTITEVKNMVNFSAELQISQLKQFDATTPYSGKNYSYLPNRNKPGEVKKLEENQEN